MTGSKGKVGTNTAGHGEAIAFASAYKREATVNNQRLKNDAKN